MNTECRRNQLRFQGQGKRVVSAAFDGGTLSSDGGILLLRELDGARGIFRRVARCFDDRRDEERVEHALEAMVAQRILGICVGYEDLNDHDTLMRDPLLAVCCGKSDPSGKNRRRERDRGAGLCGKSTLQRLEATPLGAAADDRYHKIVCKPAEMERLLVELAMESHAGPAPECIVLDMDPTDITLHGEQEEKFFNAHYDSYCYLPMYIFWGRSILCALLRPSNIDVMTGLIDLLGTLLSPIRARWPKVPIWLRADSAFSREELMGWVEKRKDGGESLEYVFGLAQNPRLLATVAEAMDCAEQQFTETGEAQRIFAEFQYQTLKSWSRHRRVVSKVEHKAGGPHQHFIVTSLSKEQRSPIDLYERDYCARGEAENRLKEQQLDLFADRTSSTSFHTNQLRLWFSAIAYAMMNELRQVALAATCLADARASTIRARLLKIGARVKLSARRIHLHLPTAYPWQPAFVAALAALHAAYPGLRL